MKTLFILSLFTLIGLSSYAQLTYSKVKINVGREGIARLWQEGVSVDHGHYKGDESFTTDLSHEEIAILDSLTIPYKIIIPDVIQHYQVYVLNQVEEASRNQSCGGASASVTTPSNFVLPTTYGGFFKYDEMLAQLDLMNQLYPHLISAKSGISTFVTAQNRPIYHVRISNSPNMDNGKPRVLYSAIHHAREPLSMSQLIFYMWYLLENYGTDPEVTFLLNHSQMFFVPCLNPDGYVYNETQTPAGGGMHRKNRNPAAGTTNRGVDLNRNYSYQWGTTGISTNANNDTYPGTAAFSEPETKAIRWLVQNYRITSGFNAHTSGDDLLFPIGSTTNEYAQHHDYLNALAGHFCRDNGFGYYKSSGLYPASGDSDDYMYKVDVGVGQKDTMFVMTPEIGSAFWPPRSEIIPSSLDMLQPNLGIAHMVHRYYIGNSTDAYQLDQTSGVFNIALRKLGRKAGGVTVTLIPLENIASIGGSQSVSYQTMQEGTLGFNYSLNNSIQPGELVKYILEINDGEYLQRITVTHQYGAFEVILSEEGTSTTNWTGNWGTTTSSYYSAPRSFTDSPNGNYANNANSAYMYNMPIDLTEVVDAKITFWAKWALEAGYDFVALQVSTDNGVTWTEQCGRYTVLGVANQGGVQPIGKPVWSGQNTNWVEEEISLSDYIGQVIKVRFLLRADGGTRGDGFYFDDFKIAVRYTTDPVDPEEPTNPEEPTDPGEPNTANFDINLNGLKVYPNPFSTVIHVDGWKPEMQIFVYDLTGRVVSFNDVHDGEIDMSQLSAGSYQLELILNGKSTRIKIVK